MEQGTRDILNIVKSGITGLKMPVSPDFDVKNSLDLVYKHKIANIFYNGLINSCVPLSKEIKDFYLKLLFFELSQDTHQQLVITEITSLFNENKVDHMLLKGCLMKGLYPNPEMRRMGDIDILIKQSQYKIIKKVLSKNGYNEQTESDHELKWTKGQVLVELHKKLVARTHSDLYSYYGDWFEKAVPESEYGYKMTDEDFLIYLLVHFTKHYRKTGIGIMHVCDIYLFIKNKKLNEEYLNSELEKLGLLKFYKNIKATIKVWFEDCPPTEMTDHITSVILKSGVFGTQKNEALSQVLNRRVKYRFSFAEKISRFFSIVFPPYSSLKNKYKILKRLPFLLPVIWIIRIFDILVFKRERFKSGIDNIHYTNEDNVDNYLRQLEYVGLNFELNKKED